MAELWVRGRGRFGDGSRENLIRREKYDQMETESRGRSESGDRLAVKKCASMHLSALGLRRRSPFVHCTAVSPLWLHGLASYHLTMNPSSALNRYE